MNKDIETPKPNNVHKINVKTQNKLSLPIIAIVLETTKGEALTVYDDDTNTAYKVFAHLNSVPWLKVNDKVLITGTQHGIIVTGRLRAENEKPPVAFTQNDDGSLTLEAGKKLTLKTLNGKIEISETGHIVITGTKIDSIATETNQIKGTKIELNC